MFWLLIWPAVLFFVCLVGCLGCLLFQFLFSHCHRRYIQICISLTTSKSQQLPLRNKYRGSRKCLFLFCMTLSPDAAIASITIALLWLCKMSRKVVKIHLRPAQPRAPRKANFAAADRTRLQYTPIICIMSTNPTHQYLATVVYGGLETVVNRQT